MYRTIENAAFAADKFEGGFEHCHRDADGLFVCDVCGERRQSNAARAVLGRPVRCLCRCEVQREAEQRAESIRIQRVERLVERGITRRRYREMTFEHADPAVNREVLEKCGLFCTHWSQMRAEKIGVLLYGGVGSGKTYAACCIANRLINNGVPVLVTSLSALVADRINSNKNGLPSLDLREFQLLVLDDLGTENVTKTAYDIIDEWYTLSRPLICSTNLAPRELRENADVTRRRLYDRVIEMTGLFLKVEGATQRAQVAQRKMERVQQIFGETS